MKKRISIAAGIVLLFAVAAVFPEGILAATMDRGERMITNEDLPTSTPDDGNATFNQMPPTGTGEAEGSSPGGPRSGPESLTNDEQPSDQPAEEKKSDTDGHDLEPPRSPFY